MDEFCKQNFISSYAYINDNSILLTNKVFSNNESLSSSMNASKNDRSSPTENLQTTNGSAMISTSPNSQSFISIRSWVERGYKFIEKKFNLNVF